MYSLTKLDTPQTDDCYNFDKTNYQVRVRKQNVYNFFRAHRGIEKYMVGKVGVFSIDGSIRVEPNFFSQDVPDFFKRSRRVTKYRDRIHLRGTRYTISSNPTFELRQKLDSLSEDFYEGMEALKHTMGVAYQVAVADYVKNSVLTVYNSFLYEEKVGRYKFNRLIYQNLRRDGALLAQAATDMFYGTFTGYRRHFVTGFARTSSSYITFERLKKRIIESYENGIFSSRHITRPEAAHPVIIAGAAALYTNASKFAPELIIGMPSGSTELAYAHALSQKIMRNRDVPVLLFPISLHSAKHDFDGQAASASQRINFAKKYKDLITNKSILIVDDNSSTGRTIDCVVDAIEAVNPAGIDVAIAEADTVRSKYDLTDTTRLCIASADAYKYAINVLPVSRKLLPKNDLKELMEQRRAMSCIKSRYLNEDNSLQKKIIGEVYIDMIKNRTADMVQGLKSSEITDHFRHTFLSNFAKVEIIYKNKNFHSVEHAYQSMKFKGDEISNISASDFNQINRKLSLRGTKISRNELPNLFVDPNISAGTSKIVGNQLRILGYVREDWDHVKVPIMTELLIQKFAKKKFYELLQGTKKKYLIEGNDWGDTFWGMDSGRGRNVLGRLLMVIRNHDREELQKGSKKIILDGQSSTTASI